MKMGGRQVLLCNCEESMRLDPSALAKAVDASAQPTIHRYLCRTQLAAYEAALESGAPLLVACTQEAPLFREVADAAGRSEQVRFTNIRERAGWCDAPDRVTAKVAALLQEATLEDQPARLRQIKADGSCLIYGAGQVALDMAMTLAARLPVTLILREAQELILPSVLNVPVFKGKISRFSGSLGQFEAHIDGYAPLAPSSRAGADFVMPKDGHQVRAALVLDLSDADHRLLPKDSRRDGYFYCQPGDALGLARHLFEIVDWVGEFEKPIYAEIDAGLCAHARSGIIGCTHCLDHCPLAAIQPNGDAAQIDNAICGGCGACAAVCPTGAVQYHYPARSDLIQRLQTLVSAYHAGGGTQPVLLLHDGYGDDLIAALARFGRGLPPQTLPLSLHGIQTLGHEILAAGFAAGATAIVILADPRRADDYQALGDQIGLTSHLLAALGYAETTRLQLCLAETPEQLEAILYGTASLPAPPAQHFTPVGSKRDVARAALAALAQQAPKQPEVIALPATAPYGTVTVQEDLCTLCMACVSACPADALLDNPDTPQLRFVEAACVQCGLCANTCPESAIELTAQLNRLPDAMRPRTLYEETPFLCIRCGAPFAAKSTIERILEGLAGQHWMYQDEQKLRLLQMCVQCRIEEQAADQSGPFQMGQRPKPRTTDDYIEAEKSGLSVDDFIIKD